MRRRLGSTTSSSTTTSVARGSLAACVLGLTAVAAVPSQAAASGGADGRGPLSFATRAATAPQIVAGCSGVREDFNGDGRRDSAIGAPGETLGTVQHAGSVTVLYGSASGPTASGSLAFSQESPGVPGTAEKNDRFGAALATGDYNGDGCSDLAVGVPGEKATVGTHTSYGQAEIFYGAPGGLQLTGSRGYVPATYNLDGSAGDAFGAALASADAEGDGYSDLSVGAPGQDAGRGRMWYFSGGPSTLTFGGTLTQANTGGVSEPGERFAAALAMRDLNADGRADFVMGAPGDNTAAPRAGDVSIFYAFGASPVESWNQDTTGVPGFGEKDDHFGASLTVADFDSDGRPDLAAGVPGEDVKHPVSASRGDGQVTVLYGDTDNVGLTSTGSQAWSQATAGVAGTARVDDHFGSAVAAGDLNGDGDAELVVGTPGDNSITVLPGASGHGLAATGSRQITQATTGVPGASETGDRFGAALLVRDLNGDGLADALVGVPGENAGSGQVTALPGHASSAAGVTGAGGKAFSQDTSGVPGAAEAGDHFGAAL